jgi:Ca2+-transporting ATPase
MLSSQGRAENILCKPRDPADEIRIIHAAVRGRVRLHVPRLYRNRHAAIALERLLTAQRAVRGVTPNIHTGNVLVLFDPELSADHVLNLVISAQTDLEHHAQFRVAAASLDGGIAKLDDPGGAEGSDPAWHTASRDVVMTHLETAVQGLSGDEAHRRLQRYGPNELKAAVKRPVSDIVAAQFKSLPVLLLIGSAALSVLTGGFTDAAVIVGVVVINAVIGAHTEAAAERTILALTRFSAPPVRTERDGVKSSGDVIYLMRGDYVPVDARLLGSVELSVAESALTGESAPASKDADALVDARAPLGDRVNMVYRGTVVTGGSGVAVVVATGTSTEIGRIHELVARAAQPETPLQRQLRALGREMVVVTGAVSGCIVIIGLLRGYGLLEIVRVAISLAVAAIPEGLPTVSTMTLATGVRRLRGQGLLVRRLHAVETLGAVQVICLDKTGTITTNRMVAQSAYVDGRRLRFDKGNVHDDAHGGTADTSEGLTWLLRVGVLCSDATVHVDVTGERRVDGTPTEAAFVHLALDLGQDVVRLRTAFPMLSHLARAERRMYMTTIHATPDGRKLIATKGRPDQVLAQCRAVLRGGAIRDLAAADRSEIEAENESMAGQGLRVLGLAFVETDANGPSEDAPLIWAGLLGIADPPRPGIRSMVEAFHVAGIKTVMITGDQSATACAVARATGLARTPDLEVLDSTGLAGIPDELLSALASRVDVFSRVSPSNKLQIVRALQRAGLVVAMTGDGINDGPAIRASNVGIALGRGGSELAREVADIVLLEDDVGALLGAIAEGRTTADDIRKSVHFIVSTNLSEILLTLGATALGFGVPLSATQLLWINLLTDVFPELALAIDPAESDVLKRAPRAPNAKLIGSTDYVRLGLDGAIMTGAGMTSYLYGLRRYGDSAAAGTMAFLTLTGAQLFHTFSARSETHSVLERGRPPNPWIGLSVAGGFGVQTLAGMIPGLRRLLGIVRVSAGDVVLSWGLAALSFVAGEILKFLAHGRSWPQLGGAPDRALAPPPPHTGNAR